MGLIDNLLGARSRYDPTMPHTYEARVASTFDEDIFDSYYADTICAMTRKLMEAGVDPSQVKVFEVWRDRESEIAVAHLIDSRGAWLDKPELCAALEEHYPGHIRGEDCDFADRNPKGDGPY